MMRVLRWVGALVGVLLGIVVLVALVARMGDGPLGPFPGGALRSGELVTEPVADWSFAADVREIEVQLVEPPVSRITWALVHEGALYVGAGLPRAKQWPDDALRDGRAVLRIEGRRYPVQAVQVTAPELVAALEAAFARKYGTTGGVEVWYFRMDHRAAP